MYRIKMADVQGGKTKKDRDPENRKEHSERREEKCQRKIKHCVKPSEPEKRLEKPESRMQPGHGVFQESRRLEEDDIKQADCG